MPPVSGGSKTGILLNTLEYTDTFPPHTRMHMHACTHMHTCANTHMYTHVRTCTQLHTCTDHTGTHTRTHLHTHAHMCACKHIHVHKRTPREDSAHPSTGLIHVHHPSRAPRDPQGFAHCCDTIPDNVPMLSSKISGQIPFKGEIQGPGLWPKASVALVSSP